ncbi:endonuclease domain-containing protein [Longimicrobium sp.]|uniref:endonuclease domain-containing protein n=1 Tax=Longimicrobium sp. TaxID=2029185 RepID=UPI002ED795F9
MSRFLFPGAEMRSPRRWRAPVQVQAAARELRSALTPAEDRLWSAIRKDQLAGLRFRRQHPVGPFILDFYCPRVRLCVELDGGIHEQQRERDQARTEALATVGVRVIRFRNEEVMNDLAGVLARIQAAAT